MRFLGAPLGLVMSFIFEIIQNYGLALLLFTVLTRVILIPLTIKQTKSQSKIAMIQPQMAEINKKYAGNRAKINEEMTALYQKVGYNPASGCLPMAAQMIILFGVIDVIFRPLTHILRLPGEVIAKANEITQGLTENGGGLGMGRNAVELDTLRHISYDAGNYADYVPQDAIEAIQNFLPQMNFLGINLMETPSVGMILQVFSDFNPVILIPIFAGITSVLLSLATMKYTATPQGPGAPNMKFMMMMMPVFSIFFTFQMPAGIGIYWIYTNTVGFAQSRIMGHFYNPKEIAEKARKQMEEEKERERLERIEAKKKAKERGESEEKEALSKKEQNRRRLAEARKRDAEKYGEQYDDSADTED